MVVEHICPLTRPVCVVSAPSLTEQAAILGTFQALQKSHTLDGVEPFVLWCLIHHQTDTLETLVDSADVYWQALLLLRDIAADVKQYQEAADVGRLA